MGDFVAISQGFRSAAIFKLSTNGSSCFDFRLFCCAPATRLSSHLTVSCRRTWIALRVLLASSNSL